MPAPWLDPPPREPCSGTTTPGRPRRRERPGGHSEESPLQLTAGGNAVIASKKGAELMVSLVRERGVDAISVRLPAVWGPRGRSESRFSAAPGLIHAAINRVAPPTTYVDDAIDMLYVKDCAKAIALLQTVERLVHPTYTSARAARPRTGT